MKDKRKYHIIVGSKAYFDSELPSFSGDDEVDTFLESVKLSDTAKQNRLIFDQYASILIVKNDNYHGIVEATHDRLGPLIEDFTTDEAEIYIHNPPRVLKAYLEDQYKRDLIELEILCEEYEIKRDPDLFVDNINAISARIFCQQIRCFQISVQNRGKNGSKMTLSRGIYFPSSFKASTSISLSACEGTFAQRWSNSG